jgi:hypothetical protein
MAAAGKQLISSDAVEAINPLVCPFDPSRLNIELDDIMVYDNKFHISIDFILILMIT